MAYKGKSAFYIKDIFDRIKSGGLVDPERSLDDVRDESGMADPIGAN